MDLKSEVISSTEHISHNKTNNTKKILRKLYLQKDLQIMALAGALWMIIFNYIPMGGLIIAFKDYNIVKPISDAPWVGLKHFIEFVNDDNFLNVLKNTLGISLLKLIIGFPLPIVFALLLNELTSLKFKKAVQTVSYLPHFLSWVILGGILINWLSDVGLINNLLIKFGILKEPVAFLGEPQYFWWIAVISDVWKELGWSAIIYLAAIAGVDPEMYEAAIIDGASRLQKIWYITLPAIKSTITILFILAISGIFNSNFDQILVLRNPLNASTSDVIDIYVYRMGIQNANYSYATAAGLLKSIVSLILLLIANKISERLNETSLF